MSRSGVCVKSGFFRLFVRSVLAALPLEVVAIGLVPVYSPRPPVRKIEAKIF